MCFFPGNKTRSEAAYQRTVRYAAYIARLYGMNINNCLVGHEQLDPGCKVDPSTGLKAKGRTYNQMVAYIKAIYHANGGLKQGNLWKAYRIESDWYNIGGDQWISGGKAYVNYHENSHYKSSVSISKLKEPVFNTVEVLVDNLTVRNGPGVDYITGKKGFR